jgi:general secretion pathway protein D/MSHA biogenesis protein MshL
MAYDSLSKFSVQEVFMKYLKFGCVSSSLLLLALILSSCTTSSQQTEQNSNLAQETVQTAEDAKTNSAPSVPASLPVMYQKAAYVVDKDETENISIAEESKLKVGARITSTRGPQPLWDIIKRLASIKGMNVSWASDVDRNVLVDVDINANDDFYGALDNMLRQVDYFHEMNDNTIVIKFKETRQFQIAMPFTKQNLSTGTGGNLLGNTEESNNVDGTINITSKDNEFDIWENIKLNIESIMNIWSYRREQSMVDKGATSAGGGEEGARNYTAGAKGETAANISSDSNEDLDSTKASTDKTSVSGGQGYYLIDKPVGLITVTAPRPVLEKVESYITTLKKSLYQQISIEAKILEVQLNDASSVGINWSNVLKDFDINGLIEFGDPTSGVVRLGANQFISRIRLADKSFNVLLNALNEQGETKILSNPKISVMNGQPAMITVGKNVTYIDSIESDRDSDTNVVTFTVNTERILSGIGMALTATVLGKDEIIMNLVPITSELQEPIEYRDIGFDGGIVGLPIVNVREMSTTVKVKGGEMLVVGGLISDTNKKTGEFAPGLGKIPVLKYLFGFEEKQHLKSELIILLRPRII